MKILRAAIVVLLALFAATISAAAYDFTCESVQPSSVIQTTDKAYRHNGTGDASVYYYGYMRSAAPSSDAVLEKAWQSMCYGSGSTVSDAAANMLSFTLDAPEITIEAGDSVYCSFMYKNASAFTGMDGNEYVGNAVTPLITFCDKSVVMNTIDSVSSAPRAFEADDAWHRKDCFVTISAAQLKDLFAGEIVKKELRISLLEMDKASFVEIGDMRIGVLKAQDDNSFEKTASDLSDALSNAMPQAVAVGDIPVSLRRGIFEYSVRYEGDTSISVIVRGGTKDAEVEYIDANTAIIHVYAAGYNPYADAEEEIALLEMKGGALIEIVKKNSDFCGEILIKRDLPEALMSVKINGVEAVGDIYPQSGESAQINLQFTNAEGKAQTYIVIVATRLDGRVLSAAAYKVALTQDEESKETSISHTFNAAEAGAKADIMVINAQTFNAVANQ